MTQHLLTNLIISVRKIKYFNQNSFLNKIPISQYKNTFIR